MIDTMTLTEFLLSRIAEDEQAARDVSIAESSRWHHSRDGVYGMGFVSRRIAMLDTGNRVPAGAGEHIARWDPARVLAECEAKRRIVNMWADSFGQWNATQADAARAQKDSTLRFLALPYADHPDYQEAWRP